MPRFLRSHSWLHSRYLTAAIPLAYFYGVSAFLVPGLGIRPALAVEFIVLAHVIALIRTFQRKRRLAAILGSGFCILLYTACFAKYLVVREPITVLDFHNLDELCFTLGVPAFVLVAVALLFVGLLAGNFTLPYRRRTYLLLVPVAVYALGVWLRPELVTTGLRTVQTPVRWRADLNVFRNGLFVTLLTDAAAAAQLRRELALPPGPGMALGSPPPLAVAKLDLAGRRNVHIVVVESLLDPLNLARSDLPADPFDPRFRGWVAASRSTSLAPSFGGASARAEFELLCGLPSYGLVDLELNLIRAASLPCLPRLLRDHGYLTLTDNPAPGTFFNYHRAYPAMGFTDIHSADDFDLSDKDGPWLSNDSFLRQHRQFLADARRTARPLFTYAFTNAGHYPFEIDTSRRPPRFPDDTWTKRAANALFHTTRAIADFVEAVEKEDPDAIIVVIGDHLPVLGTGWGEYRTREFRPRHVSTDFWGDEAATLLAMRGTILIVRRGRTTIQLGLVAHYELPEVLLGLLTNGRYCAEHSCFAKRRFVLRPNGQEPIHFERRAPALVCPVQPACEPMRGDLGLLHENTLSRYKAFMQSALLPG